MRVNGLNSTLPSRQDASSHPTPLSLCLQVRLLRRIHIYLAELSETAHGQDQDPDENVYPAILSEAEVEDGIRDGTIFDAKTLAAWACYKIRKE